MAAIPSFLADGFETQTEQRIRFALALIGLCVIGFGTYEIMVSDLLRVESDANSHAIRGYFFDKNPNFVEEWYLGTNLFRYYPPVPLWISGMMFAIIPMPGFSLSLTFLLMFLVIISLSGIIARQLKQKFSHGAFSGLMLLASYPSISRYVNGGRYGDLTGLVFYLAFVACALLYYNKPGIKRLVLLFLVSLLTMLAHFISGLVLGLTIALLLAYSLYRKDSRLRNVGLVGLAGAAPSILFWVPFYMQAGGWVAGSGVFVGSTHYDLKHWFFFFLMLLNLFYLIKTHSKPAYLIAFLLLLAGANKLDAYAVSFKADFNGLEMDGKYSIIDGIGGPAIYSVLAYEGYSGDYGSYDPGAPQDLVAEFMSLNKTDCKSLERYAQRHGIRYFFTKQNDLGRCGYVKIYETGNLYNFSSDLNRNLTSFNPRNEYTNLYVFDRLGMNNGLTG